MASSDEKIRALIGAGIPSEKVAAVTEKAQLLCEEFTSLGISKMEDKLNVILILFDIKQKKHGVAPLPDKLKSFTTISELSILSQPKKKSEQALQDWESTKFQNNELRMDFKDTASKLDESLSQEVTRMMGDKELRFQLLDVLVVSYDCFNGVYGALWENVEMTDGEGIQRYKDMQKDFTDSIHKSEAAGHTPQQNSEDLIDLYLSYALTVETFDRKMKGVASKTGAKWKLAPAKKAFRILEKKNLRPGARGVILVCDAGRGMFEAETMNDVCKVRVAVLELSATDPNVWIVRIKERYIDASSGGWRDDLINFKIMHENGGFHVFEAQISQGKMLTARQSLDGHLVFNKCRNATELLTACFGDFAPLLALAVGKAGDKMVAWAKANRWFLEDDISNWGGVRSNVDGKINGFDLVGMTMGVADKFLEACAQHCAPLVKYLAITVSGEQGTWGIASSIKPLGKNLIELRLGGCKGIEGHMEEFLGEASQLEVIDLHDTGVLGDIVVLANHKNLKVANFKKPNPLGRIKLRNRARRWCCVSPIASSLI
uniref:Uncharacterized protein n=1 Tax=Octactis speculum TaxID=3111310 RepID=A0A7S2CDD1_9STRA|mmetsp:Transcript_34653/g.46796  ORF Transcript_34653/g.46796 Transcript_34653/m.46796 type:complete len:545 (+) Transcript_34653:49-1683(+)